MKQLMQLVATILYSEVSPVQRIEPRVRISIIWSENQHQEVCKTCWERCQERCWEMLNETPFCVCLSCFLNAAFETLFDKGHKNHLNHVERSKWSKWEVALGLHRRFSWSKCFKPSVSKYAPKQVQWMNIKTHLCMESERRARLMLNIKASSAITRPRAGQIHLWPDRSGCHLHTGERNSI